MLTLRELADQLGGVWHGDAGYAIFSCSSLLRATAREVAYFDNPLLTASLATTQAGVVLLNPENLHIRPNQSIVVSHPMEAMVKASKLLPPQDSVKKGIAESAKIHPSVQLGKELCIGAHSVLEEGVCLGDEVVVGAGVIIHAGCQLGTQVVIDSGSVIGARPFNYLKEQGSWQPGPGLGAVFVGDKTQIGAHTVIDRGSLSDTYLSAGLCIDNLVHIAHDVVVGSHTIIAGCATIGAYTQIGSDCVIGGASCIAAHVHLANDVIITGMSTVSKSITKPGVYSSGTLVNEHNRWRRNAARFRRLDDYIVKLCALEQKINSTV